MISYSSNSAILADAAASAVVEIKKNAQKS
jgi:hypothetical protein